MTRRTFATPASEVFPCQFVNVAVDVSQGRSLLAEVIYGIDDALRQESDVKAHTPDARAVLAVNEGVAPGGAAINADCIWR